MRIQRLDRRVEGVAVAVIHDHVVGEREALLARRLGRNHRARLRLIFGVASQQPAHLKLDRAVDDQHTIERDVAGPLSASRGMTRI